MKLLTHYKWFRAILPFFLLWMGACATTHNQFFEDPPSQVLQEESALFEEALKQQKDGQIQSAIELWKKFITKHPNSYEAHNNLGMTYYSNDQLILAVRELEEAVRLEPGQDKIKANLARVLKFQTTLYKENKDYDKAIVNLRRIAELSPEDREKISFQIEELEAHMGKTPMVAETPVAPQDFPESFQSVPSPTIDEDTSRYLLKEEEARRQIRGMNQGASVLSSSPLNDETRRQMHSKTPLSGTPGAVMPPPKGIQAMPPSAPQPPPVMRRAEPQPHQPPSQTIPQKGSILEEEVMPQKKMRPPKKIPMAKPGPMKKPSAKPKMAAPAPPPAPPKPRIVEPPPPAPEPEMAEPEMPRIVEPEPEPRMVQRWVHVMTEETGLNVRAKPDVRSRVIGKLAKGARVPYKDENDFWYKVEYFPGRVGWVSKRFAESME